MSSHFRPPRQRPFGRRFQVWVSRTSNAINAALMVLLLVACVVGAGWNVRQQVAARWWISVPAQIERSEVIRERYPSGDQYVFHIRFRYTVSGQIYTSKQLSFEQSEVRHSDPGESDAYVKEWPVGAERPAWVNPNHPAEAVLDRVSGWEISSILLFVAFFVFFSLQRNGATGLQRWSEFLVAAMSALLITACTLGLLMNELRQRYRSRDWEVVPCEIVTSRIAGRGEFESEIVYQWQRAERTYRSARVTFSTFAGGLPRVEKLVAAYPAGSQRVCFVNPQDPAEAVLDRQWHLDPCEVFSFSIMLLTITWAVHEGAQLRRRDGPRNEFRLPRWQLELLLPGYFSGVYGWLVVSVINVAELAPIAWREWRHGAMTVYGWIFVLAGLALLGAAFMTIVHLRKGPEPPPAREFASVQEEYEEEDEEP